MEPFTKPSAITMLIYEAMRDRNTKAGYRRACRALHALELEADVIASALHAIGYAKQDGTPHEWLRAKKKS